MEVETSSKEETQKVAANLAKRLEGGDVIALFGNLGAGKTTFVQGLAKAFGIGRRILSPTFVFIRSYEFSLKTKRLTFHHLDLYRCESRSDFEALGLEDIFENDSITVIEWADKIKEILPKKRIDVTFEIKNEYERLIRVNKHK